MEVVPEVTSHNIDDDDCAAVLPNDYYDDFIFSAGDGDGGKAKEGS